MRQYRLPLNLLILCCLVFSTCQNGDGPGCDPPADRRLAAEVLTAIPHFEGQQITYDASDGSSIDVTFRGGLRLATRDNGCTEQFIMEFWGSNGAHTLSGTFDAYPDPPGFADIFVLFDVNTARGNTLKVELFGAGEITAGRNASARVLAELTRNGQTYRDVLEQTYPNPLDGQVERVYYNIEFGLLGVELVGGATFWRQ